MWAPQLRLLSAGPRGPSAPPAAFSAALLRVSVLIDACFCDICSFGLSSLSALAPAAPFGPPGVALRYRRCYCLFKFTQEPLKEPQGPLVRLPTLKTSESLKIHEWRPG